MPPADRREYLKYTGSAALAPLVAARKSAGNRGPESEKPEKDKRDDSSKERSPAPTNLQVEYAENPLGVEVEQPRLSWQFNSSRRGVEQSAYRILVASKERNLKRGGGDKWDTGKIASDQTTHIEYDGEPLESGERVYWQVQVWDKEGRPSSWSEPAHWEMGLLDESDWQGELIAAQQQSKWYPDGSDHEDFERQWVDYTVDLNVTLDEGPFGAVVRARDSFNCYLGQIDPTGSTPVFRLRVRERGQWRQLTEKPIGHLLAPESDVETHSLRIAVSGDVIETEVDGNPVDRTTDDTHGRGRFGFHVPEDAEALVHTLEVTNPDGSVLYADDFSTPEQTETSFRPGLLGLGRSSSRSWSTATKNSPTTS